MSATSPHIPQDDDMPHTAEGFGPEEGSADTPENRTRLFRRLIPMMSMSTPKGGRPHKGARVKRTVRIPERLDETIVKAAEAAGYKYVQDYIVDVCAYAHRSQQESGMMSA